MRVRTSLLFALTVSAAAAAVVACTGTYDHPCESLGGECVTGEAACAESMPQLYCATGTCCLPSSDAGATTASSGAAKTDAGK